MLTLVLTPRLQLSLSCKICRQNRNEEKARQATMDVTLYGQEPFATCPCCHQKVESFTDPRYQERARTYFEKGETQMTIASAAPIVMKDDVWMDLDPRAKGREIRVLSVDDDFARCKRVSGTGPVTKIRLDRFKPSRGGDGKKGFKFVSRPPIQPIIQPGSSVAQMQSIHGPHDLQAD